MQPTPFIAVARVIKAHGLRGEMSIAPMERFEDLLQPGLEVRFAPPGRGLRSATIVSVRRGPKGPLVSFDGVDTIDDAVSVRGATLMVRPEDIPEHLVAPPFDPIGLALVDQERGALGTVTEIIRTGANDVWIVSDGTGREILIPVIDDVVLAIDEDSRTAEIRLLPGLVDE